MVQEAEKYKAEDEAGFVTVCLCQKRSRYSPIRRSIYHLSCPPEATRFSVCQILLCPRHAIPPACHVFLRIEAPHFLASEASPDVFFT